MSDTFSNVLGSGASSGGIGNISDYMNQTGQGADTSGGLGSIFGSLFGQGGGGLGSFTGLGGLSDLMSGNYGQGAGDIVGTGLGYLFGGPLGGMLGGMALGELGNAIQSLFTGVPQGAKPQAFGQALESSSNPIEKAIGSYIAPNLKGGNAPNEGWGPWGGRADGLAAALEWLTQSNIPGVNGGKLSLGNLGFGSAPSLYGIPDLANADKRFGGAPTTALTMQQALQLAPQIEQYLNKNVTGQPSSKAQREAYTQFLHNLISSQNGGGAGDGSTTGDNTNPTPWQGFNWQQLFQNLFGNNPGQSNGSNNNSGNFNLGSLLNGFGGGFSGFIGGSPAIS